MLLDILTEPLRSLATLVRQQMFYISNDFVFYIQDVWKVRYKLVNAWRVYFVILVFLLVRELVDS